MPTHANRDGLDMSKPDTRNLHRHAPGSNPNASEITEAAEIRGCPDTPEGPNGPENANAEAAGGPVTPKPTTGGEMPGGGQFVRCHTTGDERRRLLELAAAWNAAGCVVHPAKADGSKVPMSVADGGANIEPAVYAATYSGGPRAGQPHPHAGQPHPRAGQHGYGWKRLSTGEYSYPFELTLARLRGQVDGIGLFCGSVSGGLEMFELEGRAAHLVDVLEVQADRRGIREVWDRFNAGCSEWTPSGGIHWMARRTGGPVPGNTKLATRPDPADPKNPLVFAETRGQGGWVVVAGSFGRTHASGKPYVLRTGSPATIPVFTVAEAEAIHALFGTLDEMPEHTTPTAGVATLQRRERPAGELLPGDDFNQRATWAEVLPPPWAKISSGTTADAWSMHGQGGRKTADVYHNDNTLFIYDTECPGQGRKLSLFSAYVWLHHSGDFHAAASALYALGFGTRAEKKTPVASGGGVVTTSEPAEPPPVRVETFPTAPMVTVEELRASITTQIADIVATRPALAVLTPGTAAGKTHAATRDIPAAFDRVVFNVDSHDNAAAVVAKCRENGFDAGAIPPVNENTCAAWDDDDARRLAAQYGRRPGLSMRRAMSVGMSQLACHGCPLNPGKNTPPPVENELAFLEGSGWDVSELPAAETSCRYWQQRREAESKPVVAQCQERTRRNPGAVAPHVGETVAVITDENAVAVLAPRALIDAEAVRAVGDTIRAAADNLAIRVGKMRFSKEREDKHVLASWARAVAGVADDIAANVERMATEADTGLHGLDVPPVNAAKLFVRPERQKNDAGETVLVPVPQTPHVALAGLLARSELPAAFNQDAFELVRLVATGKPHGGWVHVSCQPNKKRGAHIHRTSTLELPAGVVHIVLDATAPLPALRQMRPDALFLEPPGKAAFHHAAFQVWKDIRPDTHPAVVLDALERLLELTGWQRAALVLCKRHRKVLFPQTRPRHGTPKDLPANVEAIANWNAGKRHLRDADTTRRLEAAKALAARVERLRARLAVDEHGNARVEHMRGTVSRGSNTFMADSGVDGLAVVGFTRCNPSAIVGHLLATGQADAVQDTDGKWTPLGIAGTLPTVNGGTRDVRWSGYADQRWADAAAAVNRAELVQTWSRGRPQLPPDEHGKGGGVPVGVIAGEPCGLPLLDLPERAPDGVRAVVAVVEKLAAECEARQVSGVVEPVQNRRIGTEPERVNAVVAMGSMRNACIGHTIVPLSYTRVAHRTGLAVDAIAGQLKASRRAVQMWLADAVERGLLARSGTGRWTRYALPGAVADLEVARVQVDTKSCPPAKRDDAADPVDVACPTAAANSAHVRYLNDDATTTANAAHVQHLNDDATTANSEFVRHLDADTANAAFLEAAAELDDAWEPWLDDTVAAAATVKGCQKSDNLIRHQPTNVWRVVSSEPHRHRSPVAVATTPTTHGQRGGHARPPPRRVDAGTGG